MIREAKPEDLAFLMHADLEGVTDVRTAPEQREHRDEIAAFLDGTVDAAYVHDPAVEPPTPANRLLLDRVFASTWSR